MGARLFDHYEEQLNGPRAQIQEKERPCSATMSCWPS